MAEQLFCPYSGNLLDSDDQSGDAYCSLSGYRIPADGMCTIGCKVALLLGNTLASVHTCLVHGVHFQKAHHGKAHMCTGPHPSPIELSKTVTVSRSNLKSFRLRYGVEPLVPDADAIADNLNQRQRATIDEACPKYAHVY